MMKQIDRMNQKKKLGKMIKDVEKKRLSKFACEKVLLSLKKENLLKV